MKSLFGLTYDCKLNLKHHPFPDYVVHLFNSPQSELELELHTAFVSLRRGCVCSTTDSATVPAGPGPAVPGSLPALSCSFPRRNAEASRH